MVVVLWWFIELIGFLFLFMFDVWMVMDCVFDIFFEINIIIDFEYLVYIENLCGEFVFENVYFCY